jgi:hypothetical protein
MDSLVAIWVTYNNNDNNNKINNKNNSNNNSNNNNNVSPIYDT